MKKPSAYCQFVEKIGKRDFITFYNTMQPEKWYSRKELAAFSFPQKAASLAGRYLIKKAIGDYIKDHSMMNEIEIVNNDFGKPDIILGPHIQQTIKKTGIKKIDCSISHSRNYITGLTIISY
jgi:phosphopantetheinyl transferase (holo-ACP synthase)